MHNRWQRIDGFKTQTTTIILLQWPLQDQHSRSRWRWFQCNIFNIQNICGRTISVQTEKGMPLHTGGYIKLTIFDNTFAFHIAKTRGSQYCMEIVICIKAVKILRINL